MKQLFNIQNEVTGNEQLVLLLQLGKGQAAFAIVNRLTKELVQLKYYAVEEWDVEQAEFFLNEIENDTRSFYDVHLTWGFCKNSLVPVSNYNFENASEVLKALYGSSAVGEEKLITESLPEWQLQNVYAIPQFLLNKVVQKFPTFKYKDFFSLHIAGIKEGSESGTMMIDFDQKLFTIIIEKNSQLKLAQVYEYEAPADVLYYLLKACSQFSLSQQHVQLQLSGLVDKDSSLYKELHQYFINIIFKNTIWQSKDEYPAHFFAKFNDLLLCAS